ncbi:hypothetical protein H0A36_09050 [Endozoicomonas sp. SM1973]|uniref:Bestrophin n=1 Tax=Spartinivicinus marinus TaxID=2994442 RepID=A0A853I0M5_9GAMM|nr:bestrophin family ion channel [Spartinivicinus marinus]MCX4028166.1 bestrophin family ion channel [Spartinivicinus marinus]NYZ66159.1 hypothetical protein [Spartinivicinus marinus]
MIKNKPFSFYTLLKGIGPELSIVFIYAIVVERIDELFKTIEIPVYLVSILGTFLSILCSFMLAQSYDRWWEARKIWGGIVNESRTLIRKVITFVGDDLAQHQHNIALRQIIWCHAMAQHLRYDKFTTVVLKYIEKENIDNHVPNTLLDLHYNEVNQLRNKRAINEIQQLQINKSLNLICDYMGQCERIKNTIFPISYKLIIKIGIYVFATILPVSINGLSAPIEIFISFMVPSLFLLIYELCDEIQAPFKNNPNSIPIENIAHKIQLNIEDMCHKKLLKHEYHEHKHYVI